MNISNHKIYDKDNIHTKGIDMMCHANPQANETSLK